jgi:hypothetical protein
MERDMNTIDRLTAHLEELDHAELHGTGVEAVMDAGKRYQRRRTAGMTVAGLVMVGVLAFGANALQSAITDDSADVTEDGGPDENDGSLVAGGSLEWVAYESPLAYTSKLVGGDGTVYALTTAPNTRGMPIDQVPQAIFATTDGGDWTNQVLPRDLWVQDLAERGGTLYAIGTAPGVDVQAGDDASVRIGTSDDAGVEWAYTDLDLEAADPGGAPVGHVSSTASIAAGESAVVAAVTTQFFADYSALVPEEFTGDNYGVVTGDEGLAVVDWNAHNEAVNLCQGEMGVPGVARRGNGVAPGGEEPVQGGDADCEMIVRGNPADVDEAVVHRATWDELGLERSPMFAELFVSPDGTEFERVPSPFPGTGTTKVVAVEGGFVGTTVDTTARLWFSPDGRTWTEAAGLPVIDWVIDAAVLDGRLVVMGSDMGRAVVASAPDIDGAWTTHDLPVGPAEGMEQFVGAGDVGESTAALGIQTFDAGGIGTSTVLHSADLVTWSETPLAEIVGPSSASFESMVVTGDRIDAAVFISNPAGDGTHLWSVGLPAGAD